MADVLVLPFDGTNGSAPVDVSSAPHTITAAGGAALSTAQSNYGGSSLYLDGTGDYLTLDGSTDFVFGTGDYTIEMWVRPTSSSATYALIDFRPAGGNGAYPMIYMDAGLMVFYFSTAIKISAAHGITSGTWAHVAVCRSGSSTKLFINGSQIGSTFSDSSSLSVGTSRPVIGASGFTLGASPYNGYIDELRVSKGEARYTTSPFTPPDRVSVAPGAAFGVTVTEPYAIFPGEASALGTFYAGYKYGEHTTWSFSCNDEPSSPYAVEDVGAAAFQPSGAIYLTFGTVNSSTVKKHGSASLLFPSGAYVLLPTGAAVIPAYADFTLEFWIRVDAVTANTVIIWGGATGNDPSVYMASNAFITRIATSPTITYGEWNHYAMCRKGNMMRHYLNGVRFAEALSLGALTISQVGHGNTATVYLDSIGFANGFAYYDANDFVIPNTPFYNVPSSQGVRMQWNYSLIPAEATGSTIAPSEADSQWQRTALLIQGGGADGSTVVQEAKGRKIFNYGVINSAAQHKNLQSSLYFDGASSILISPSRSLDFFDGSDFTIEFWMYPTRIQQTSLINKWGDTRKSYAVYMMADGTIDFYFYDLNTGTTETISSSSSVVLNNWSFVAVCKYGTNYRVWVNGVGGTIVTTTKVPCQLSNRMYSGAGYGGDFRSWDGEISIGSNGTVATVTNSEFFLGFMEDLRITNGYARYQSVSLFSTPLTAFIPSGGGADGDVYWNDVVALFHFDEPHGTVTGFRDALGNVLYNTGNIYASSDYGLYGNALYRAAYSTSHVQYSSDLDFSTGDFTIEFFSNAIIFSNGSWSLVSNNYTQPSRGFQFISSTLENPGDSYTRGYLQWVQWNSSGVQDTALSNLYIWNGERSNRHHHIAVVRKGNDITIYVDGVGNTTTITRRPAAITDPIYIGSHPGANQAGLVVVDELRITKTARYSTNFAVPMGPFPEQLLSVGQSVLPSFYTFIPGEVRAAATAPGAIVESAYSVIPPIIIGKPKVDGIVFNGNGYSIVTEIDAAIGGEGIPEALAISDDIFARLAFSHAQAMSFGDLVSAQAVRNIASALSFGATASAALRSVQLSDSFTLHSTVPPIRLTVPVLEAVELTSSAVPALGVIVAAQISIADTPIVARGQVLSEIIALSMPAGATSHRLVTSDNIAMTGVAAQAAHGVAADTLALAETTVTKANFTSSLTDAIAFDDTPRLTLVLTATVADDIALNDIPAQQLLFSVIMQEGMQFSTLFTSPVITAWALNMRNAAVTQYSNFQYNSFAKMGERYLGANDQGLWWMDGTLDGIRPVNSRITTGIIQPNGNKLAGVQYAYLGMRGTGQFIVTVTDEAGSSYNYTLNAVDMETSRVVFGRGFRTRYFTFSLESNGQDFDLDNIEFVTSDTSRKLQR